MSRVAVIGSGFIGRAWAISFARAGHEVVLWDRDPEAPRSALAYIEQLLPDLEANDLLNGATARTVATRMRVSASLSGALDGAVHVQENTPEAVDVKRRVFADLDALAARETVLASSTSAILPSAFTENLKGRERCLVVHPINPPYLIPAAEVVPSPWTDATVIQRTAEFLRAAGHAPIVMGREIDGFVMNRLQGALLEEAFRLVAQGYASVEDVDVGIRDGLALRWAFMGPFETIDLNAPAGVRDYAARYQGIYSGIFPTVNWRVDWGGPVMDAVEAQRRKRLPADKLGERQAWRDRRLMALAAHKRRAEKDIGS
ncbi:MAG: 3-hydroxyacyl-CoA dehydrogenase [Hyphomicrobiales bacterium]|nr:3-hydroxyacyl-CoA dehydrogenase [Hyphomicrobiales bacterium]